MISSPVPYHSIFEIKSEEDFNEVALRVFHHQYLNNEVYRGFISFLGTNIDSINHYREIPFLPISFFKTHRVITHLAPEIEFFSSGTTGSVRSKHLVADLNLYDQSLLYGFELAFGPVTDYCFYALLPSYHENKSSSLIYMVQKLMDFSGNPGGFFLGDLQNLATTLEKAKTGQQKIMLIGVSYALLDLADLSPDLEHVTIIETGGMKGRRKEMIKADLHQILKKGLNVKAIGSEYGMTELLSQAWSKGDGIFTCPPWMKVLTREYNDPLRLTENHTGGINVIDLANVHSCSFIATQDLGLVKDNQFQVAGRFDDADLRGCNLLVD